MPPTAIEPLCDSSLKALALTTITGTSTIIHDFLLIELKSAVPARIEQPSGQYSVLPFNAWALSSENVCAAQSMMTATTNR